MNRGQRSNSVPDGPDAAALDAGNVTPFTRQAAPETTLWERLSEVPEMVDRWNFRLLV
jgi:hypothetical protein